MHEATESWSVLRDVLVLMSAALLFGFVFEKLKQSAILGYLLAGTLLGRGAFNLITNDALVSAMSELGVALLLFTIGLHFSLSRLRAMGAIALLGGTLQLVLTTLAVGGVALLAGLGWREATAIGLLLGPSSTACVLRVLGDRAEMDSPHGRNSVGILLLQDLALVPMVLIVTTLGSQGSFGVVAIELGRSILLMAALVGGFVLISNKILPRLFDATALSKNRELVTLLAVITALGSALVAHSLELSAALGAFIAGVLLAESPFATQIRAEIGVLRTLFVTLFFAAVGMLADLRWIAEHWVAVAAAVAVTVLVKAVVVWAIIIRFRVSYAYAIATGISLAQIGEFSFVLAGIALQAGLISDHTFRMTVSASLGTLLLTPFLVAWAPTLGRRIERALGRLGIESCKEMDPSARSDEPLADHIIIVGFGPAGQGVYDTVAREGRTAIVLEMNPRTVAQARAQGIRAEVGDASAEEVLTHLSIEAARAIVVTLPDARMSLEVIRTARALAPDVSVLARARYHRFAHEASEAGAHVVVDEEERIGQILGSEAMRLAGFVAEPPAPPASSSGKSGERRAPAELSREIVSS